MKPLLLGYDAQKRPVRLEPEDRRIHMHVMGSSGSGKSKFLESMIRGDLQNGQGFCLIDPHGTLYHDVVSYCAHYVDRDVIQLDLSNPETIIGFNPFQKAAGADISVQIDNRVKATMHAWNVENTDATPTLARMLRLIYAVMLEANLGLRQIEHLIDFHSGDIRAHLIEQLSTPLIAREWRELQRLKVGDWRAETLSAKNRLFRLLSSSALGRVMGVPGFSIDLQRIMDEGKVLLVNLATNDRFSEEDARTFGALLVNEFFETAKRRQRDGLGRDPKPYYLYMDEFQNFVSLDVARMLDEVRKFGLFLVLAHQRFGQLDEELMDGVLTNCRIKAVFGGLAVQSARRMAEELFIGELDPMKIKVAIYQTKFWPQYSRDKIYTHSTSQTRGTMSATGSGSGENSAFGSFSGSGTSATFFSGSDWFGPQPTGVSAESASSGSSRMSGSASSHSEMSGESESTSESYGEADVPIFIPVPFQELSSVQYFSLEEQLTQLTAALKEQYARHSFIKILDQKTQPLLVPFVKTYFTPEENFAWYVQRQYEREEALPAAEVDRLIEAQETALLQTIRPPAAEAQAALLENPRELIQAAGELSQNAAPPRSTAAQRKARLKADILKAINDPKPDGQ